MTTPTRTNQTAVQEALKCAASALEHYNGWTADHSEELALINAALASLPQPAVVEVSLPELPQPVLYAHELLANGGGIWLGCDRRDILEKAHDDGETGDVILSLVSADQLHARDASILAAVSKAMGVEVKGKANG